MALPTEFIDNNYISLATFRKSGAAVATPVWAAHDEDHLVVFSAGDAGKVKRLRNSSRAKIATCTVRGSLTGDWYDAQAYLMASKTEVIQAHAALVRKYGLQMKAIDIMAKLGGRYDKRAFIRIELS